MKPRNSWLSLQVGSTHFVLHAYIILPALQTPFWQALLEKDPVITPNVELHLKESLMGDSAYGSKLIVRKAYIDLFTLIDQHFVTGMHSASSWSERKLGGRGALVIGNPGIGKSWFLIYVLHRLASRGHPIVYRTRDADYWY